jgi:hypothetical protein
LLVRNDVLRFERITKSPARKPRPSGLGRKRRIIVFLVSAFQRKTEAKLAELHRQQAAHRKSLHGPTVNRVLRMGNVFKLEKLSYLAFQRQYGRSVGMRAPGMFVEFLRARLKAPALR